MAARFRRLATSESDTSSPTDADTDQTQTSTDTAGYLVAKAHAGAWVLIAALVAYLADLPRRLTSDPLVATGPLHAALVCISANTVIMLYLTLW
jgi:hypothetical protein